MSMLECDGCGLIPGVTGCVCPMKELNIMADQLKALTVDELAELIRKVDGNHSMGAGALAEALLPFLYAAPSPTEQASDVREQLLQLCETERIDQRDMACCDTCSGLTYNDALADLAKKVRALSAPAAKGNAQDEVKS